MGNNNSVEAQQRPPLQSKASSSSTATVTPSARIDLGARRRSLDLPDVYGKDLTFTSASLSSAVDSIDSNATKWPKRSNTRGRGTPTPGKSTKAGPTISNTLAAGVSSSSTPGAPVAAVAAGGTVAAPTIVQPQAPQQSISMTLDQAEGRADVVPTPSESQMGDRMPESISAPASEEGSHGLSPALPLSQVAPFPTLPVISSPPSSFASGALQVLPSTVHPPLTPPVETIVAPFVPASAAPLPLGSGASQTTSLIIGQPLPIISGQRTRSPSNELPLPPVTHEPIPPSKLVGVPEAEAAGGDIPVALPISAFPIPPEANAAQQLSKPGWPAAAPIAAGASTSLAHDQKAQEAVMNATVDLDAGPDAVPTLLTWRPSTGGTPGDGGEGGVTETAPKTVYVTGTFAKGWTTKIEMRKKKSANEFTAIVALPPGQHQLKFIVDKQWTTSRNLPSATDPDGNLINYLLVRGPQYQTPYPLGMGYDEDLDDAAWGTEIPQPIQQLGTDLDNFEAEERKHKLGQSAAPEYPYRYQLLQKVMPPSLPAPLKEVPLNKAAMVAQGSGDDNSILHKPDHSILDHLCASPISKGLLSVAVTKRYRRKFVTTILYRPIGNAQ